MREHLPSRRASTTFDFECADLRYVCSYSCYADGRIGELFLGNHKSNSAADTSAREVVRRALCRDSNGKANSPLGTALDFIFGRVAGDRR
jgi:hypothetical protein